MSLKRELQEITEDTLKKAYNGYCEKIVSLGQAGGTEAVENELIPRNDVYRGISGFPGHLMDLMLSEGMDKELADNIVTGASLAINTLIDIAEAEEVPKL